MKISTVRILIICLFLGGGTLFIPSFVENVSAFEDGECLDCHGDSDLTSSRGDGSLSLYVNENVFADSIHGANGITCSECHADVEDLEHPERLEAVDCGGCHEDAAEASIGGIHSATNKAGNLKASCKDCHGTHDILPVDDVVSPVYPLNIPATCGACHGDESIVGAAAAVASLYTEGQHGISTTKGMLGAAICTDCHGSHAILSSADSQSPANRQHIVATCVECHVGAGSVYDMSVHGKGYAAGADDVPTCADCHNPHSTLRVDRDEFLFGSVETCGNCHHGEMATYMASYHGQITDLGYADTFRVSLGSKMAKCVSCHGSHEILPTKDPASLMSMERRLDTCRQCHPSAEKNFIGFAPHLDHSDADKYPVETAIFGVMSALLINVFLIFSIHTLLWFIRSMFEKLKGEAPPHLGNPTGRYFIRFNYYHRITHFLIFTSFVVLSLTGLPLKFHDMAWAKMLAAALGGFEVAGILHRMMGAVTFGYFGLHLAYLAYLWISGKMKLLHILWGPRSIVPQPNDAVDIANNFKWFLGMGPRPKFGRFTYWEKFDYFAVFWGVALIGLSGLILWFPELTTRLLPGMAINIAWIIHADEALLATGFIFLIHFYNTHLRVEKFPLDPVILTGRIDEEEMRHERPLEFELCRQDGSLREIQATPPDLWLRNFARIVGWTFVFIGVALLIGMMSVFFV